jgi:hypothetical protein
VADGVHTREFSNQVDEKTNCLFVLLQQINDKFMTHNQVVPGSNPGGPTR